MSNIEIQLDNNTGKSNIYVKKNEEEKITIDDEESQISNKNTKHNDIYTKSNTPKQEQKREIDRNYAVQSIKSSNKNDLPPLIFGYNSKPVSVWFQQNKGFKGFGGPVEPQGAALNYEPQSRNIFVKFVFSILLVKLLITAGYMAIVLATHLRELYEDYGLAIIIASSIVLIPMNYVMACCACSRTSPCSYISMFIVVVAMSNLASAITVKYDTHILVYAFMATVITVAVCIALACSSFDFTKWYLFIVVIGVTFTAISLALVIAVKLMGVPYKPVHMGLVFVGSIINVVVLTMELQMILGGRTVELAEDEYALGAYMLYMSIMDLFLQLVQMIAGLDDS